MIALSLVLCLVANALHHQVAADGVERRLLLGHGAAPGNPRSLAADEFASLVSETTDGRLRVQVFGAETFGSDSEMMVSVASGTLDITANSQGSFSVAVPEAGLFGLPFLFDSPEHAYAVIDGPVGDQIAALAEEKGYHVLAWWDNGIRHTTNSRRPVEAPEDLKGLRIRTPDDPMTVAIFDELGANPTPMDFGELYLGLRQGAVDGQENPLVNIAASRLNEVQTELALTGHKYEVTPFLISTQTWDSLEEQDRQVLTEAAASARDHQRELMAEQSEAILSEFEESLTVTEPDREALREATAGVYDTYEKRYPELVDELRRTAEQTSPERSGS
ncbi:TRAP transporter substrate-binding protein [Nocardiopsis sp. NPDC006938]|uniref:TRAP transporter substrate-binding protein n=1 Tax=Nocardiopsis sp. NPDC006938 TaxID=3364337 RepID=UPI0036C552D9